MKKTIILLNIALFLFSCGGGDGPSVDEVITEGNLANIRAKKEEISTQYSALAKDLKKLEDKIKTLDSTKKALLITSFIAKEEKFDHFVELQGNVNTRDLLIIYPEYSGILTQILVKEGGRVSKGQVIGRIDDGGLSQQLAQLEIQTELAKTTFEKQEGLWNKKVGSEIQYLQAKSSYEAQAKAVKQLKEQIEKTIIKAPFTGIIDEIITEQGSLVSPGVSQIARIISLNKMYIETDVPEAYISTVTKDKAVMVNFPVLGKVVKTKVNQVGNYINPANRTFKIEIPVGNEDGSIKPNLTAKLKINDYTSDNAILIPQSIISENAEGRQYIYTIKNKNGKYGFAEKTIITTGKTSGDLVEVTGGITNGMEVIEEGARSVKNGQEVKIANL